MMRSWRNARAILCGLVFSVTGIGVAAAELSSLSVNGDFRVRQEFTSHTDFMSERASTLLRLRPELTWTAAPELSVLFQPQAAKAFGETTFVPNSPTTNAAVASSGNPNSDTSPLSFHQAYADYHPWPGFNFRAGRQILKYGDELMIGAADWANVARSFDALKISYRHPFGTSDLFTSKLRNTNVLTGGPGDKDLHGFYNALTLGRYVDQFDLYVLDVHDATPAVLAPTTLLAFGARVKSALAGFDYRAEYTHERGFNVADGDQFNAELGWTFQTMRFRPQLSAEYFMSTANYFEFYPTPHKWLGYADVLGRRNVDGIGVHATATALDDLSVRLDYYYFKRHSTAQTVFRVDGLTPVGFASASGASTLGNELDLTVKYQASLRTAWSLGYNQFFSGGYFNDQFAKHNPNYAFLQFEATY